MKCHDLMKNRDKKHISDGQLFCNKENKKKVKHENGKTN
jgi:hypothetical protein